jgi:TldD protein
MMSVDYYLGHYFQTDAAFLQKLLNIMGRRCVDDADVYCQHTTSESWTLEDSQVKYANFSQARGIGLRVMANQANGLAYVEGLAKPSDLIQAAEAVSACYEERSFTWSPLKGVLPHPIYYTQRHPIMGLEDLQKVALLNRINQMARTLSPHVKEVSASLSSRYEVIVIADLSGHMVWDVRPMIHLSVNVMAMQHSVRSRGSAGSGGRLDWSVFLNEQPHPCDRLVTEAVRQALLGLEARAAPAGTFPVVLGPGWPGILLHEAVGHGLEGDFNRKGVSAFSGRLGQAVASPLCTVIDDGTLPTRRGSLSIDDEGTPSQKNVLIQDGILQKFLQDKLNARLMNVPLTGNGRRESYAHVPMPRMTNTYMASGESSPSDILASLHNGLYAVTFDGGQVDITSGQFVFTASEAYWVENGVCLYPVKNVVLTGKGSTVLSDITAVGNDMALDWGIGTCGKDGQSVPVGVGQPTVFVRSMTIGGTAS